MKKTLALAAVLAAFAAACAAAPAANPTPAAAATQTAPAAKPFFEQLWTEFAQAAAKPAPAVKPGGPVLTNLKTSGAAPVVPDVLNQPLDIDKAGLDAASPFDVSAPKSFDLNAGQYRPTEYSMPAVITHSIAHPYFAIKPGHNPCMICHGDPEKIGKPKLKGVPTVTPASHWYKTADGQMKVHGRRWECTICHAPQANVRPLVETLY